MLKDTKWDKRFIELADHVAQWSRDPSTKVGAVIVRSDKTVASMGFNGFPRGVDDSEGRYLDKPTKYQFVCHAEANAIVTAKENLSGCTIYVSPLHPCNECAKLIIQSGITRVVTLESAGSSWTKSFEVSKIMFAEAGVEVDILE